MEQKSFKEKNREKAVFWSNHIKQWEGSGQSQIDYCRANNLSRHHFTYWKIKNNKKETPLQFISVVPKPSTLSISGSIEPLKIQVGNKYRIEVGEGFSDETLRRLINTLSGI